MWFLYILGFGSLVYVSPWTPAEQFIAIQAVMAVGMAISIDRDLSKIKEKL